MPTRRKEVRQEKIDKARKVVTLAKSAEAPR